MQWNSDQKAALNGVNKWLNDWKRSRGNGKQIYRLFGYAGTGKSTLARHLADRVNGEVVYAAFTGKAALVMRKNGCVGARTIHSALYLAEQDEETGEVIFRLNKNSPVRDAKLVIIDECSMVDDELAADLLSFNTPILVLGDPGQLPPIKGTGFFTNAKPDSMLQEIHRQAKDNPIIHLATMVRNGDMPDAGEYGSSRVIERPSSSDILDVDQVLVGRNVTRERLNKKIRKLKGLDPDHPVSGDKVICLANNKDLAIYNGGMFTVKQILAAKYRTNFLHLILQSQDEDRLPIQAKVHKSFLIDEVDTPHWKTLKGSVSLDYGYAITTHKSQGSQWDRVFIQDESYCFRGDRWKWLYTAVTRASESITLLRN